MKSNGELKEDLSYQLKIKRLKLFLLKMRKINQSQYQDVTTTDYHSTKLLK